ncbi:hypothetical protein DW650_01060 [Roseburia sp. AM23-20]|jgi:hypothetical protein|uniref:hypothetical protein n=1 Tax=Roseburia sp. AM23-20 TaxID=2292066 RepID=UPI000E486A77|nr:hypothetical protein [Roseburia sp. AM23-20]RHF97617.1 hypothetical protein DW650_01060 [Roseburia sp. AM23-20]
MKKTTGICLFTGMIFLLLILVVYLLSIQQNTGIVKENLTASTESISDENDTEQIVRSTEIIAICEPYTYVIKQKNGVLVVYQSDGVTEFFETNIRIRDLDADMVKKIENGIFFSDDRELYDFLESYSS